MRHWSPAPRLRRAGEGSGRGRFDLARAGRASAGLHRDRRPAV